ncbi:MAG: ABC transporter ATP-binding protein [Bacteroidetes bacterium]|nr:ABC transporter ATP-binding protein [Bacteroidota bacterium]MCH8524103.1 ABC transporter ATP-binding protein [Balneolales bacterium]
MIHIRNLSKQFGNKTVLSDVNLDIHPGTCYGLLGNNGAGKSTLINILLDLIPASVGEISIGELQYPGDTLQIRSLMGVLPEKELLHAELTAYEQLQLSAMLYGIAEEERDQRIRTLFNYFFDSEDDLDKVCGSFSTGMRKKVGIIGALLHRPDILILDEPFSGLDPGSSLVLIDFLKQYLTTRRIGIISSHNLSYIEQLATHIGVLHGTRLLFNDTKMAFLKDGAGMIDRTLFAMLQQEPKSSVELNWLLDDVVSPADKSEGEVHPFDRKPADLSDNDKNARHLNSKDGGAVSRDPNSRESSRTSALSAGSQAARSSQNAIKP